MFCMKCGVKIGDEQVFCQDCLSVMARYPVKPGTVVQLPSRPASSETRKPTPRKREVTAEKKLRRAKRAVVILTVLLVTVSLMLGLLIGALWYRHQEEEPSETKGQNYTPISTGESIS